MLHKFYVAIPQVKVQNVSVIQIVNISFSVSRDGNVDGLTNQLMILLSDEKVLNCHKLTNKKVIWKEL